MAVGRPRSPHVVNRTVLLHPVIALPWVAELKLWMGRLVECTTKYIFAAAHGGVAERLIAPVLKTGIRDERIGGSNPSSSAAITSVYSAHFELGRRFSFYHHQYRKTGICVCTQIPVGRWFVAYSTLWYASTTCIALPRLLPQGRV